MSNPAGIVSKRSKYGVPETIDRLFEVLAGKQIQVFARIDHSGEAAKAGLTLRPTQVLVFGAPQSGTPLMAATPLLAIDLPLKALAWEDADGQTWLSYNSPEYLQERFGISEELIQNIAGIGKLVELAIA